MSHLYDIRCYIISCICIQLLISIFCTAGVDYDSNPQAVVFPPSSGASEMCFEIAIRNDDVVESNEEFLVNLQIPGGTNADIGTIDSTCVQIIDDDGEKSA